MEKFTAASENFKQKTEESVLAFCRQNGLFFPYSGQTENGQPAPAAPLTVIAAVSGGADSMALLHLLLALSAPCQFRVEACHVNHGLRGEEADRDERFVAEACAALHVPLHILTTVTERVTVPEHAGEEWARTFRYGCFEKLLRENTRIATAHTMNDQAETLLFRLARGTGARGAAGIAPRRGGYIRPLLCLSREDTERYCQSAGQQWVTDSTNLSDAYARNRIRRQALPALCEANGAAVRNLSRFCGKMSQIDDYFTRQSQALLQSALAQSGGDPLRGPWNAAPLAAAEPLVLEYALHSLTAQFRDPEEKYIALLEKLLRGGSGAVCLTDTVRFSLRGGLLSCDAAYAGRRNAEKPPAPRFDFTCGITPGIYDFGEGFRAEIQIFPAEFLEKSQAVHKKDLKWLADYDRITMPCCMRTRAEKDKFRGPKYAGGKTLKKLYNERGYTLRQRSRLPLLACDNEVIWLYREGFAAGYAPGADTKTVIRITPVPEHEGEEA